MLLAPTLASADCQLLFPGAVGVNGGFLRGNINGELARPVLENGGTEAALRSAVSSLPNPEIFWVQQNAGVIRAATLDGANQRIIATVDLFPRGIAVDNDFVYVTEHTLFTGTPGTGKILRMNKDGSNVTTIVSGIDYAPSIAVGPDGKIYWITNGSLGAFRDSGAVFSANPDGSGVTMVLDLNVLSVTFGEYMGSSQPKDIAIDSVRNKIYVADNILGGIGNANRVVWRANLDGTEAERFGKFAGCEGAICGTCPSCSLTNIHTVAIDSEENNLYYQMSTTSGYQAVKVHVYTSNGTLSGSVLPIRANFSSIIPLGTAQGLCNSSNTLSGTSLTDYTVWRPSEGNWYLLPNQGNQTAQDQAVIHQFGLPGDIPRVLNFNGDNELDMAVWRPAEGNWYLCDWKFGQGCLANEVIQFGLPGDVPLANDVDNDGTDDLVVWRPASGNWYIRSSRAGQTFVRQWGLPGDVPLVAHSKTHGSSIFVIWRPSDQGWYLFYWQYETGYTFINTRRWGLPGDIPLTGDYNGDDLPELVVYRPHSGDWFICPTTPSYVCERDGYFIQFGLPGDVPIAGDFDGDGKYEPAVWRPSTGTWYYRDVDGNAVERQWGLPTDYPVTKRTQLLTNGPCSQNLAGICLQR